MYGRFDISIRLQSMSSRLGAGREADNLTLQKEFCCESSKEKILEEAKSQRAVVPLMYHMHHLIFSVLVIKVSHN
jgi:hypothetical protein